MPRIHTDLHACINKARGAIDADHAIEALEDGVEAIDAAVGFRHPNGIPDFTGDVGAVLDDAHSCIRNDDLVGARLRFLQAVEAGGPPLKALPDKPLEAMKKAELVAFAAGQAPPVEISQSSTKAAILEQIQDELVARKTAAATAAAATAEPA